MSEQSPQTPPSSDRAGWIHFGIVSCFLLIAAVGWTVAMDKLGFWLRKEPIPWPKSVEVNEKTFQNTSFAKRFGPFRLAKDGELEHPDDLLSTLKIGSTLDRERYSERMSNWYINRIYEDTSEPEHSPYRFWHLDVVFYTGGEVTVPHVPDICVQAGGARPTGRKVVDVKVPEAPEPWRSKTQFVSLGYERLFDGRLQELAQYYLFSVNGEPETRREMVRAKLANPAWRYVYYSKVQFFPRGGVGSMAEAEGKAKRFLRFCLPEVLKELPTPEDIDTMSETDGSVSNPD